MKLVMYFLLTLMLASATVHSQVVPLGLHGSPEYVDETKTPRWAGIGSATLTFDEQGWPQQDFEWILDYRRNKPWNGPDFSGTNDNVAGVYQMSFSGQATLSAAGSDSPTAAAFVNQTYDASTQTTNVSLVMQPGHLLFILSFTNTMRPGQAANTGLTNIHMYKPGYSLANPQLFTDRFLDVVEQIKSVTFRSFDTGINSYEIWYGTDLVNNTWATRSLPTDAYWPLPSRNVGNISGLAMPWEIYMQICLQTNTPGWFNLPVGADDEYVQNFALLLKNGNQWTKPYPSDLPIYIEHSNEVWNFGFSQYVYNAVRAKANNLTVIQNYVSRVFQISKIFRSVFGDAAMGSQIRLMCMWQYGNWENIMETLVWAQGFYGGNVNSYIWGIGEAPYVNPLESGAVPYGLLDPTGVDRIIDSMYTSAGQRRQAFTAWQAVASYFGINVGGYESGPALGAGIEGEASRSMRLADFIKRYYLENYFSTGAQTANYFALGPGGPDPFGDWYLFEHWGQYAYGRFDGYMNISSYLGNHIQRQLLALYFHGMSVSQLRSMPHRSLPAIITNPVLMSIFAPTAGRITSSSFLISFFFLSLNPLMYSGIMTFLLRSTTSSGSFSLILTGSSQSGASLSLYLDNVVIKSGVSLPNPAGNVTIPFTISSAGLHTIALFAVGTGSTSFKQGGGVTITLTSGKGNPTAPSVPLNLAASSTSSGVELLWEIVATATSYTVSRSSVSGGPYNVISKSSVMNNSFVDTTPMLNQVNYYVVTAANSAGTSALSMQVQVVAVQLQLPASPQVTITSGVQSGGSPASPLGQAYLIWNAIPNAQYYDIPTLPSSSLPLVKRAGTSSPLAQQLGTCYYDATLTPGQTYSYNITAVNPVGSSPATTVSTTVPKIGAAPGTPTNLVASLSGSSASLQWDQAIWSYPEFAELFVVQKASSTNGPWTTLTSISTNNAVDYSSVKGTCYRVYGNSGSGGMSASPSNTACV